MAERKTRPRQDFFPFAFLPSARSLLKVLPLKGKVKCLLYLGIKVLVKGRISNCTNQQEFSRAMDQSQPMKDFAANLVAKATVTSSPTSSLLRNSSDVSLVDMGDDRCFTLTKALGYHVIYGRFYYFCFWLPIGCKYSVAYLQFSDNIKQVGTSLFQPSSPS